MFVYTAAIPPPGELYVWPAFPTRIQRDDNDWISGITWSTDPLNASGRGTFYTDLSCSGPAASCPPKAEGTVEFAATTPETCTVSYTNPSTGAKQAEHADVYDYLQYSMLSGPQSGQTVTLPSPCTGPSKPGRCRTSALYAQPFALAGGGAAGSQGGAFGLTNRGTVTCTLLGYPGMQLLDANGQPLPTTVIRGHYEVVDTVPEQTATLAPGAQARFYYMYSDTLGGGNPTACPTASTVEITPPGAYNHLTVATSIAACEGHIWVSPVTTTTPYPLLNSTP